MKDNIEVCLFVCFFDGRNYMAFAYIQKFGLAVFERANWRGWVHDLVEGGKEPIIGHCHFLEQN